MHNVICIIGRLTKDLETYQDKETREVSFTNFSLAFSQGKDEHGLDLAGFIDCVAFGKLAATLDAYLTKGDKIAVSGRLEFRKYVRKDGTNGVSYRIICDSVEFIDLLKDKDTEEKEEIVEAPKQKTVASKVSKR